VSVHPRASTVCAAKKSSIRETNEREPATFVDGQQDQLADALTPHAIRALRHHADAQSDDVVNAGAIASDRGLTAEWRP
jgi:hypothetical protein